jgi:hypothetical protein
MTQEASVRPCVQAPVLKRKSADSARAKAEQSRTEGAHHRLPREPATHLPMHLLGLHGAAQSAPATSATTHSHSHLHSTQLQSLGAAAP